MLFLGTSNPTLLNAHRIRLRASSTVESGHAHNRDARKAAAHGDLDGDGHRLDTSDARRVHSIHRALIGLLPMRTHRSNVR